jgi:hypothetical protein
VVGRGRFAVGYNDSWASRKEGVVKGVIQGRITNESLYEISTVRGEGLGKNHWRIVVRKPLDSVENQGEITGE